MDRAHGPATRPREETYRGADHLKDRKTETTGADSDIGRAVASAFAREGAGRKAVAVACDIREEDNCRALVERAVTEFGRIDAPVNSAACQMSPPDGIEAITTEQFDRVMHTSTANSG